MKRSTEDQAKGRFHEVKGKIKEKMGQLTNNPDLEGEGIGEKIAGKIQKKIGQVEKVIEKPWDGRGFAPPDRTDTWIREGDRMSFGIYSIGFAIVIGGLVYAAYLLHMPAHWIAVGAVVLLGVGILKGVKTTRQKDPVG
jgi:uncharacterized protein YjbJ (UPF0337 family)